MHTWWNMAEEIVDLIEESNDELENWIYYSNEIKSQENPETSSFTDIDASQLLYVDSTNLVSTDNEQRFQYDYNDEGIDPSKEQTEEPQDNIDVSEHNIILKETIDENGQLVEEYLCGQCNISFNSIEDFLDYHPSLELLNENPEEQEQEQLKPDIVPMAAEDRLWDLVENLDEEKNYVDKDENVEIKPIIANQEDESSQEKEICNNAIEMDKERYFCYDCQQVFTDLTTAENHDCNNQLQNSSDISEQVGDNSVYKCQLCNKEYTSFRSFNNHQRWHTNNLHAEPSVCTICNTIFASEKNLKLHMKMHKKHSIKTIQEALPVGAQSEYNELNKFFCEICNKSFDQKLLVIHKNMHQNLEEHTCVKCNKKFENLPSYEIHMQMHIDTVKKGNTSKMSNKTNDVTDEVPSTSTRGFIDAGKRKHACQYCGKEFQRPYEKVKHERIHTGEKPYECEVCGKTFRVSYSLTLHLRTHTDIRPYVCATCNKRFKQQSVYVHHLKTHEAECAYKCDICGKSFRTLVQLAGHKNTHSKPYNCTECNRPFASLYAVKIHMKTHNKCHKSNKNLKNRCSICGASYARVFALSLHIKEQHGINADPVKLFSVVGGNENTQMRIEDETALLINASNGAVNQEMHYINADDEEVPNDVAYDDGAAYGSQVDHEENIQNTLASNIYMDETEAATQAILNTEEISIDNFPTEEIITDWLVK